MKNVQICTVVRVYDETGDYSEKRYDNVSCEDVPETHLHLCQVDTGDDELRQIVCGAPNVTAGIKVIVAVPGARIADNYKIKKGKIRGMESLGMICSLQELGLPESIIPKEFSDGIQILPEDAKPGDSIFPYLDLDDEIVELSITPNRADALSMRGVAHEVAAIYGKEVHFPEKEVKEVLNTDKFNNEVELDERVALDTGIQGVPYFIFNNKYPIPGVLPSSEFVNVLKKIKFEEDFAKKINSKEQD